MKKMSLILFCLLITGLAQAQQQEAFKDYNWDENPQYQVDAAYTGDILGQLHRIEMDYRFEGENFVQYELEHRAVWLNSDDKIEAFNKIYLPYQSDSKLLRSKARVITSSGKIIELDDSDIHTAKDEETGRQYKYFAFEGVEKGSTIEYFYVAKKYPHYKGTRITLQNSFDSKNIEFDLYSPKNLIFEFKSYNGLPAVERDTTATDVLHWQMKADELKGLVDEEMSPYDASRAALVYKLDKNLYNNTNDISSYGLVAQNLYEFYYPEHSKKTLKALDKFLKAALASTGDDEASRIRKLEYYIKTNVYFTKDSGDELSDLDQVLEKKVASEAGMMKLYTAALTRMGIPHEVVLTSDRMDLKFDKDFEAHNFLNDFLLYFPDTDAYLSPTENSSRYGFPPATLTDNYGLFIREVKVGDFKSGVGEIKYIEPVDADASLDKMHIEVDFDKEDLSTTNINLNREFHGYYAMMIQPFVNLIKEENRDNLLESFGKMMNENVEVTSKEMLNDDPELFGIKPLIFNLKLHSDAFIEKAGNKYLFKIGELIGEQTQLYQEKERVLPLENDYERTYKRNIVVHIPEGYRIVNPEDLNINESYSKNGEKMLSFNSFYELKGNTLDITADEFYKLNLIDKDIYEDYRKVINSAADFNKITLVLAPVEETSGTK